MSSKTKVSSISRRKRNIERPISLRKVKNKAASNWFEYADLWKMFIEETTLDGLHLFGTKNVSFKIKAILASIWFLVLSLALVLCFTHIRLYFKYEVHTTVSYNSVYSQQFPAISFCNNYFLKKSIVGLSDDFIALMTKISARNNREALKLIQQVTYIHIIFLIEFSTNVIFDYSSIAINNLSSSCLF